MLSLDLDDIPDDIIPLGMNNEYDQSTIESYPCVQYLNSISIYLPGLSASSAITVASLLRWNYARLNHYVTCINQHVGTEDAESESTIEDVSKFMRSRLLQLNASLECKHRRMIVRVHRAYPQYSENDIQAVIDKRISYHQLVRHITHQTAHGLGLLDYNDDHDDNDDGGNDESDHNMVVTSHRMSKSSRRQRELNDNSNNMIDDEAELSDDSEFYEEDDEDEEDDNDDDLQNDADEDDDEGEHEYGSHDDDKKSSQVIDIEKDEAVILHTKE